MSQITVEPFYVVGITVRTSNQDGQAARDIPALWERWMANNLAEQIPGKMNADVYSVYTDYEKDYTAPYTTLLGCRVADLSAVPEGMTGITVGGGNYTVFTAEGALSDGIVIKEWMTIWNSGLSRRYTTDFEVYGEKAMNPANAQVDIYIAV